MEQAKWSNLCRTVSPLKNFLYTEYHYKTFKNVIIKQYKKKSRAAKKYSKNCMIKYHIYRHTHTHFMSTGKQFLKHLFGYPHLMNLKNTFSAMSIVQKCKNKLF